MNKGLGLINKYKGTNGIVFDKPSHSEGQASETVSDSVVLHSSLGEYSSTNRPKGGGHGQESIDYMDAHGIPYEVNVEYNNGVRAGNLPTHKQSMFHSGNRHTWFPKTWSPHEIKSAGEFVANKYKKLIKAGMRRSAIYKNVRVTVIFGNRGEAKTIFPSDKQPGGIKND